MVQFPRLGEQAGRVAVEADETLRVHAVVGDRVHHQRVVDAVVDGGVQQVLVPRQLAERVKRRVVKREGVARKM